MALERPRQPEMQSRLEIRRDDPAEAQLHADFTRSDGEDAAAKPQQQRNDCRPPGEAARGNAQTDRVGDPVAQPEPLFGNARAPHADDQERRKQHRAGGFDRVGDEIGGSPEGQAGINSPGLIERVESKAGGEGHDRDGGEVDAHGPHAEDLQQHHETADIGGRTGEQKHQRGARAQTLECQRRRHRRR